MTIIVDIASMCTPNAKSLKRLLRALGEMDEGLFLVFRKCVYEIDPKFKEEGSSELKKLIAAGAKIIDVNNDMTDFGIERVFAEAESSISEDETYTVWTSDRCWIDHCDGTDRESRIEKICYFYGGLTHPSIELEFFRASTGAPTKEDLLMCTTTRKLVKEDRVIRPENSWTVASWNLCFNQAIVDYWTNTHQRKMQSNDNLQYHADACARLKTVYENTGDETTFEKMKYHERVIQSWTHDYSKTVCDPMLIKPAEKGATPDPRHDIHQCSHVHIVSGEFLHNVGFAEKAVGFCFNQDQFHHIHNCRFLHHLSELDMANTIQKYASKRIAVHCTGALIPFDDLPETDPTDPQQMSFLDRYMRGDVLRFPLVRVTREVEYDKGGAIFVRPKEDSIYLKREPLTNFLPNRGRERALGRGCGTCCKFTESTTKIHNIRDCPFLHRKMANASFENLLKRLGAPAPKK